MELGAEATLDAKDSWQAAQHQLYGELSQQLQKMWANGKMAQNGPDSHVEPSQDSEPPAAAEYYCQEHHTPFKRYRWGDNVWYSHKTGDRKWCREK